MTILSPLVLAHIVGGLRRNLATHSNYYDKYAMQIKGPQCSSSRPSQSIPLRQRLKLDDVIKLGKLDTLGPETISDIWRKHFETKAFCTGFAITGVPFNRWWLQCAPQSPTFVVPLAVGKGFCNMFMQHRPCGHGGVVAMSTLDDYQKYGEAAPVRVALYAFGDLVASKNLGLLMSDFDGTLLTRSQVETLVKTCLDLYTTSLYEWVHTFNHNPAGFDYYSFLGCLTNHTNRTN